MTKMRNLVSLGRYSKCMSLLMSSLKQSSIIRVQRDANEMVLIGIKCMLFNIMDSEIIWNEDLLR